MERERIKKIAIAMVKKDGLINLSCLGLCDAVGISDGSFLHVMGCTFLEFVEELTQEGIPNPHKPVIKSRTHPTLRKQHILDTAVELAHEIGYENLTRDAVAELAGISGGLVSQYFTMADLKNDVMGQAVDHEIFAIIAQGIVNKHPRIKFISNDLRLKAIDSLNK